ncbi:MAG: sigma-54-dependent Fis family transcriptional regulator [Gammaproteobacteria bacterium]|nr:sigma-54-dependent Fis family transcriptional regulator [Gammaproteobacteria bacterium]MDL1881170.1 sigma-54-dependent Fis family transcriptional regulator [Gammaproteobacteria bacterium PRO2]
MSRPLALVVDDEPDIRELLTITLQRMDIDTRSCGDVASAKAQLRGGDFQLCLTDMRLPDGDGLDLVAWMQASGLRTPVAVITAHGNVETAVRALKSGAFDFISKPLDLANLRKLVANALKLSSVEPAAPAGRARLLGESAPVQKLREMITRVARSQAPVHITGESGTGKELVARMIHDLGARAAGPFMPVNCGAIPGELMESEFFGHRKGAFTGAVADKPGLFQGADGGTLFLDEIAELPLPMQVKLLRVIQEKTIRPIGQPQEVPIDVRILSATHKDLRALVAAGQFREDLFYRINVIELRVPPLRERGGDILLLTRHLLERQARELGLPVPALSAEAARKLAAYAFPGNVRELENIVERAVALSAGGDIVAEDIQVHEGATDPAASSAADLGERIDSVQREAIQRALEANRFNKTAAARQLGLTLRALRYRMGKLGME